MEQTKKQTAVNWLVDQLNIKYGNDDFVVTHVNEIGQAIEMEKYQLLDAYVQGSRFKVDTAQSTPDGIEPEVMGAVDYYDNVYNK